MRIYPGVRRHAANAAVCLVLGGITTIAVSWACALWSPMLLGVAGARPPAPDPWFAEARPERREWVAIRSREDHGLGVLREHRVAVDGSLARRGLRLAGPGEYAAVRLQAGWPLPCVQGMLYNRQADHRWEPLALLNGFGEHVTRGVPLRPLLGGLVANTTLFAAVYGGLGAAALCTRRALRRRRGSCTECGYPRRVATPRCSECGAPA